MLLTPNLVARSLFKRHSHAIPSLIESTQHPIFPELAAGIDETLIQKGEQHMWREFEKRLRDLNLRMQRWWSVAAGGLGGKISSFTA